MFERNRPFVYMEKVFGLWVQLMKNGGKNKTVAFIILFSVCIYINTQTQYIFRKHLHLYLYEYNWHIYIFYMYKHFSLIYIYIYIYIYTHTYAAHTKTKRKLILDAINRLTAFKSIKNTEKSMISSKDSKQHNSLSLITRNVSWAPNQCIRTISEGSCDTED